MVLNWPRLRRMARRCLGGHRSIESLAERSWTLCPAERSRVPPAIFLPGQIEKVRGFSPWRRPDAEWALVRGEPVTHEANRAHLVRDVDVFGSTLYKGRAKGAAGGGAERWHLPAASGLLRLGDAHLVGSSGGSRYFGFWMRADLPLALLADGDGERIVLERIAFAQEAGYRELLGMPSPVLVSRARVERLVVYEDRGQTVSRERRYQELRARLRRSLPGPCRSAGRRVYLKRGRTGQTRCIVNEPQVEAALARLGFQVVEPSTLQAREVAEALLDASIVVTCEGSHAGHAIYAMAHDAALLVLQPPDRFSLAFKEFTDRMPMRFAFVVGDAADGGFSIDVSDLDRTVERAVAAATRGP
jgi:Glycosyltransferase 61